MRKATVFCDGGSRGNPGPAGCACVLQAELASGVFGAPVERALYIGRATNNEAEYRGLLLGLGTAVQQEIDHLQCVLDSQLVVKQVLGEYATKDKALAALAEQAQKLARENFLKVEILFVPRYQNKLADALVTKLLDDHTGAKRKK